MSIDCHDPREKACDIRYILTCKVEVKDCSYEDEQSKGTVIVNEKLVFLIPQDNDQRSRFYHAWLPDSESECQELSATMGHPIFSAFRVALWRTNHFMQKIHLFVMSKGAEEMLKKLNGKNVTVEILGQNEDHLADGQLDYDISLNKNKYDKITHLGDNGQE